MWLHCSNMNEIQWFCVELVIILYIFLYELQKSLLIYDL